MLKKSWGVERQIIKANLMQFGKGDIEVRCQFLGYH